MQMKWIEPSLLNPVRFVAACSKGHLQDIDWRFVTHITGDRTCRKPLYWVERGVSSDPSDVSVRCICGASVTLGDLYKPGYLGGCRSSSPWLQPPHVHGEECRSDLRLLPRSATNTYFPQTVTMISLTKSEDQVLQAIQEHRPVIDSIRSFPNFVEVLRSLPTTKGAFREFSDADIIRALDTEGSADAAQSANPRIAEFDLLACGAEVIGNDGSGSFLYAETLPRTMLRRPWDAFLKNVVKVHRLREVMCLYGFTRLEPLSLTKQTEGCRATF